MELFRFKDTEQLAELRHSLLQVHSHKLAKRLFLWEVPEKVNLEGRQEPAEMGSMHPLKLLSRK
jgi:hypothetical protein